MVENTERHYTQIVLSGPEVGSFLYRQGLLLRPDASGEYVIADFTGAKGYAVLGRGQTEVNFQTTVLEDGKNHDVVLKGDWVKRGRNNVKKLPFPTDQPEEGLRVSSRQQFRNGVDLYIRTTVPTADFKKVVR